MSQSAFEIYITEAFVTENSVVYTVKKFIRKNDDCVLEENWLNQNGKYHRLDEPAIIQYNYYGIRSRERYYYQGQAHNISGPALIEYFEHEISYVEYFILGKYIDKKDYLQEARKYKFQELKLY